MLRLAPLERMQTLFECQTLRRSESRNFGPLPARLPGTSPSPPACPEGGKTAVGIAPREVSPMSAAALPPTPMDSRTVVGPAPAGLCPTTVGPDLSGLSPTAALPSALQDYDRPLSLLTSTSMLLKVSNKNAWLSLIIL